MFSFQYSIMVIRLDSFYSFVRLNTPSIQILIKQIFPRARKTERTWISNYDLKLGNWPCAQCLTLQLGLCFFFFFYSNIVR